MGYEIIVAQSGIILNTGIMVIAETPADLFGFFICIDPRQSSKTRGQ
jgi:hypothetical protein